MDSIQEVVAPGRAKNEFWRSHVARQQESGQTQAAYCERHGLKVANFHYWKRRLASTAPSRLRFVPIRDVDPGPREPIVTSFIQIRYHGVTIQVREDLDVAHLAAIVDSLAGRNHVAD